jgi:malonate-semialdehyde dehydrogenase (acetylating) / methylmalonate-semialdehyde dehydrogenase
MYAVRTRLGARNFATSASTRVKAPLFGLNDAVRARAEQLSAWKGTSAVGEVTKNFIGGEFVEVSLQSYLRLF